MAKLLKLRRGTTTQHASFTGAEGEVTIDTTKDTAVVHDGSQAGGRPLLREDMSNLPAGTIDNADVNVSAAISGTKISPDFGSQNIVTTGTLGSGDFTITSSDPLINFVDSGDNPDYRIQNNSGELRFRDTTNSANRLVINSDGHVDVTGNLDVGAGIDVTGNVVATGNIEINSAYPIIKLTDTNNNDDFEIKNADGIFIVRDATNSVDRLSINSSGSASITGSLFVSSNITTSGTVDGRDVAADGTKLDGIESGATADQTKSDIDALNINADQVDGVHASQFLRSDINTTATGDITVSGGGGALTVAANSDIRLTTGSWSGNHDAKIQHHANTLYIQGGTNGHILRDPAGHDNLTIDANGNGTFIGNVTAYSDRRLKTDVHTINDALGICGKLRGVSYKWIKNNKPSIGVIAQEIEEVIPEVVLTNINTDPATGEETEVKSVDYGKIVGVLINAINELKAELDTHKKTCCGGK